MSFSPAALRPRLQTEFYEFLEQKLLNVESQLSASEKERDALGVALTQAEKKLEASNVELNELRTNAAASIEALSNKDEVAHSTALLRQDLQRVSDLLARERARREEAERVTSETEAKVKTLVDKLAQCNSANEELKKKCSQESATQLTKITRLEATTKDMEKENTRLREEVVNKEKICSRAVAERAEAIAAETECRRQSNYVKSELDAVKKEISSLRTALNSITASTSDQLDLHSSAVKLRGFVDDLRALPAPAVAIDLAALTPVEIPASQHVSEILSGLRRRGVLTGFEMTLSDNLLWLPNSNHAMYVVPMYDYVSSVHSTKWWRYTRCIKSKETREIFHTSHGKLYYVGTYQRVELGLDNIQLEAIDIKLFQRLKNSVAQLDLKAALAKRTTERAHASNALTEGVPGMYQWGILKAKVIGLQCIGFNRRLNDKLHPSKSPSNDASPDGRTDNMPPSSLKRRECPLAVCGSDEEPPKKEAKISR